MLKPRKEPPLGGHYKLVIRGLLGSGIYWRIDHILSNPSIKRFENCPVRGTRQAGKSPACLRMPSGGRCCWRSSSYYPPAPPGEKGKVPLPLLSQLSPLSSLRDSEALLLPAQVPGRVPIPVQGPVPLWAKSASIAYPGPRRLQGIVTPSANISQGRYLVGVRPPKRH